MRHWLQCPLHAFMATVGKTDCSVHTAAASLPEGSHPALSHPLSFPAEDDCISRTDVHWPLCFVEHWSTLVLPRKTKWPCAPVRVRRCHMCAGNWAVCSEKSLLSRHGKGRLHLSLTGEMCAGHNDPQNFGHVEADMR